MVLASMLVNFLFLGFILTIVVLTIGVLIAIAISRIISNLHGVPYVYMKRKHVESLLAWAGLFAADVFYDLGCGDARVLISAVKDFGIEKAIGYEVAPWAYLKAKFAIWLSGVSDKVVVHRHDFFEYDLSGATFVYAYLFPEIIDRLAFKLAGELRVGSRVLCPSFPIDLARHPEFRLLKSEKIGKIMAYLYERV